MAHSHYIFSVFEIPYLMVFLAKLTNIDSNTSSNIAYKKPRDSDQFIWLRKILQCGDKQKNTLFEKQTSDAISLSGWNQSMLHNKLTLKNVNNNQK